MYSKSQVSGGDSYQSLYPVLLSFQACGGIRQGPRAIWQGPWLILAQGLQAEVTWFSSKLKHFIAKTLQCPFPGCNQRRTFGKGGALRPGSLASVATSWRIIAWLGFHEGQITLCHVWTLGYVPRLWFGKLHLSWLTRLVHGISRAQILEDENSDNFNTG